MVEEDKVGESRGIVDLALVLSEKLWEILRT